MTAQLMYLMIFPDLPLAARRVNFRERSRRNFQQLALFVSCRFLNEAKLLKVFVWKTREDARLPSWKRFKTPPSTCWHLLSLLEKNLRETYFYRDSAAHEIIMETF